MPRSGSGELPLIESEDARPYSYDGCLGPIGDLELGDNPMDMKLDGALTDYEPSCYLAVALSS